MKLNLRNIFYLIVGLNVLENLEKKAAYVDWHKQQRKIIYVLFSIHGFSQDLQSLAKIRKDIYLLS